MKSAKHNRIAQKIVSYHTLTDIHQNNMPLLSFFQDSSYNRNYMGYKERVLQLYWCI